MAKRATLPSFGEVIKKQNSSPTPHSILIRDFQKVSLCTPIRSTPSTVPISFMINGLSQNMTPSSESDGTEFDFCCKGTDSPSMFTGTLPVPQPMPRVPSRASIMTLSTDSKLSKRRGKSIPSLKLR